MSIDLIAYLIFSGTFVVIFAVAALGLNLQFGCAGLFNVGIAGFFAIGAYTSAILTGPHWSGSIGGFGLPVPLGIAAAAVTAGIAAFFIGLIVLRLGGDHLAIATFGIAAVIYIAALNLPGLTQGPNGLFGIPTPFRAGPARLAGNALWLLVCTLIAGLAWWLLERITATPWGRTLQAVAEDEIAAEALGKDTAHFKLQAFVIGSALCGLAGALYAHFTGFISPQDFLPILTFQIYAMVIIGGTGRHAGSVLGAAIVWILWTASGVLLASALPATLQGKAGALRVVLIALVLLLVILWRPAGLVGEPLRRRRVAPTAKA